MTDIDGIDRSILKKCSWKEKDVPCSAIFKKFPTDRGLCCSFNQNAAEEIFLDSDYLNLITEKQNTDQELAFGKTPLPDFYTQMNEPNTQSGKKMGLQLILDAHSDVLEAYSVRSDYQGFTGLITNPGSYLLADLKSFQIQPGQNNMVAVSAVLLDADDNVRDIKPVDRKCLFADETTNIKLHRHYSQENCLLECGLFYAQKVLKTEGNLNYSCTPWYFPFPDNNYILCNMWQNYRISNIMQNEVPSDECNYCLPDCRHVIYSQSITAQPFRRCDERNIEVTPMCSILNKNFISPPVWGKQVYNHFMNLTNTVPDFVSKITSNQRTVKKSYQQHDFFINRGQTVYDAFDQDIAILNVFFDSTTVMQFKTESRQSWYQLKQHLNVNQKARLFYISFKKQSSFDGVVAINIVWYN